MSKLRVAVVGVGSLSQHHARIAAGSEATDLVAVVDPGGPGAGRSPGSSAPRGAPSMEGVLDRVDAVQIAAPTGFHHALGLEVLRAGNT